LQDWAAVQRVYKQTHSKRKTAEILGISRNTVKKLLALDEVDLQFEEDALRLIASRAKEKGVGARALRSVIEEFMLDIMYEVPKDDNIGKVTITKAYIEGTGGPLIEMRGQQRIHTEPVDMIDN
jgi:ATP-dependent Clp protease ATP-binding subunit ClpX